MKWRLISLVIIGVAALLMGIVALGASSSKYTSGMSSAEIAAALSDYDANAAKADNVYQQQVVNGWAAKDLLAINDRQNVTMLNGQAESLSLQSSMNSLARGVLVVLVLLVVAVVVGFSALLRSANAKPKEISTTASGPSPDPTVAASSAPATEATS